MPPPNPRPTHAVHTVSASAIRRAAHAWIIGLLLGLDGELPRLGPHEPMGESNDECADLNQQEGEGSFPRAARGDGRRRGRASPSCR
jgi:hypothetical protein